MNAAASSTRETNDKPGKKGTDGKRGRKKGKETSLALITGKRREELKFLQLKRLTVIRGGESKFQ